MRILQNADSANQSIMMVLTGYKGNDNTDKHKHIRINLQAIVFLSLAKKYHK